MSGYFLQKATIPGVGELEFHTNVTITHARSIFGLATSKEYFEKVVLPNLQEFYKSPLDVRKALNACISLYHLADWHWTTLPREEKNNKKNNIPYNEPLESIANGSKHFNTQKTYQSGEVDGSFTERSLTLNCGEKTIILKKMLEDIQKYWERELG